MKVDKKMAVICGVLGVIGVLLITVSLAGALASCDSNDEHGKVLKIEGSEVTVCYYIPDLSRPYEQEWLGGDKLEAVLTELAATEFTEAEEDPDEGSFRAALVIATNEEQITVHMDEDGRAWTFYEGRWMYET